jgi:hypothetical protein
LTYGPDDTITGAVSRLAALDSPKQTFDRLVPVTGTSALTAAEVDELRRAAAVRPLDRADVRRVLESHREVLAERAELVDQLRRLGPAWTELRGVLNELNRVVGADSGQPAT